MQKILHIFICLITFTGCSYPEAQNEEITTFFSRKDFIKDTTLTGEVIEFNAPLHPLSYTVIRDSLIFVTNWDGKPYFIEIYNINSNTHITSIARKGNGPNEVLSCYLHYRTKSNYFYIHDIIKQNAIKYSIDSVLAMGESYTPYQIKVPEYTSDLTFLNTGDIIGFNNFHFKNEGFDNDVPPLFKLKELAKDTVVIDEKYAKYFTANVSSCFVIGSPTSNKIWLINRFKDKIDIYNNKFQLVKTLKGPDNILPEYSIKKGNAVIFKKEYKGFLSCYFTDDAVYLNYIGVNGISKNENYRKPVEIYKFNWSGELLHRYNLDKYIFNISIDTDEKYLYGTHFGSPAEYPKLIRYNLTN